MQNIANKGIHKSHSICQKRAIFSSKHGAKYMSAYALIMYTIESICACFGTASVTPLILKYCTDYLMSLKSTSSYVLEVQ